MTREEARDKILELRQYGGLVGITCTEALDMAIDALEQEPCEDAINREDVLMALTGEWTEPTDELIHRFIRRIKNLPSVNPQPKTGHWLHFSTSDDCSKCGWSTGKYISPSKYCPNCGCRMVEPQESEDKE